MLIYIFLVKPHLNEDEYARTEEIVHDFENGVGRELHEKFLQRTGGMRNWVWTFLLNAEQNDCFYEVFDFSWGAHDNLMRTSGEPRRAFFSYFWTEGI